MNRAGHMAGIGVLLLSGAGTAEAWLAYGHVYCDANLNYQIDAGDSPVPSVLVVVTNFSGSFSNWTAGDGSYLVQLPSTADRYGVYLHPATLPSQSTVAKPDGLAVTQFSMPSSPDNVATNDFLIQNPACAGAHSMTTVHGHVYCDANGTGQLDSGDQPLAGVQVIVRQEYGSYSNSTVAASDGTFNVTIPNFDLNAYRRDPLSQTYVETVVASTLPPNSTILFPQPITYISPTPAYYVDFASTNSNSLIFNSGTGATTTDEWLISSPACQAGLITLSNPRLTEDHKLRFDFTASAGTTFSILASSDASAPLVNWVTLGTATEISPGAYQFTDSDSASAHLQRFYRIRAQ